MDPIPTLVVTPYIPSSARNHFHSLPSKKITQSIAHHLELEDLRSCRLVSRRWNVAITNCLTFTVTLSDMTMLTFLRSQRADPNFPELHISKLILVDLTPLSVPFSPQELEEQFNGHPETVKSLHFMEAVASSVKTNFLTAFKWIEALTFEKAPIVLIPEGLVLQYIRKFEMSPGSYNESDDLLQFFKKTLFPCLEEASLHIHCRNDHRLYASAHYFIARHYRTLRKLKLLFLESLTTVKFSGAGVYARDVRALLIHQRREIENEPEYSDFLQQAPLLQLESLSIWLIDQEHLLTMSLKLINSQKALTSLEVNHPYGSQNLSYNFSSVIEASSRTLKKITVPPSETFDCSVLRECSLLEEFSIGMELHFHDFESLGKIINVQSFPLAAPDIQTVSMGSSMLKLDILWMLSNVPASTFMFIGLSSEEYSMRDMVFIIRECGRKIQGRRRKGSAVPTAVRKSLMMCISMSHKVFQWFEHYLNKQSSIYIRVLYHSKHTESHCGTAHFSLDYTYTREDDI